MSTGENKKIIPKFKKKLQGFLSDESGKISKEDVLKMGMIAMGVAVISMPIYDVMADHFNGPSGSYSDNGVSCSYGHSNSSWVSGTSNGTVGSIQSQPFTATVNGHVNAAVGSIGITGTPGHSNGQWASHNNVTSGHGSHGSHGSHAQW